MGLFKGKLETIPLLTKLGLTITEIAEELDVDRTIFVCQLLFYYQLS